jgi:hypothetical protein
MEELEQHALRTRAPGDAFSDLVTIKLDSCHWTWHFQPVRMRFRRMPKGRAVPAVSARWHPYYGLHFDDAFDGFTVVLNPLGTQLLRSWCHQAGSDVCENCADDRADVPHEGVEVVR